MKSTLLAITLLLALSFKGNTQVIADPATTSMDITDMSGTSLNANQLAINNAVLLKVPIFNHNQPNDVPSGTIFVKIGLGTKITIDPAYDLTTAPLSDYFIWTAQMNGLQMEIVGNLIAPLPSGFADMAVFKVIPIVLGSATIADNVLITNHNTTITLSDEDPANNNALLGYTVVQSSGPVPVTFTKLNLLKKGCNINVNFFVENEINVKHYEIETSKNGSDFITAGTVIAASRTSYLINYAITPDMRSNTLFVRVKSVDLDGSFAYSQTKTVSGLCDAMLQYNIYPNPVTSKNLMIQATSGIFNGKYKMTIVDMRGRVLETKDVELNNVTQYNYELKAISSGSYILRIANSDGSDTRSLPFEKM